MNKKRAVIYVFSGTGNTYTAAEMTAGALKEYGYATDIYKAEKPFESVPDPNDYDIAGFAYPIHAFNCPQFFLRFVKRLNSLKDDKHGMKAFIFKTSGEPFRPNNASSFSLCGILRKKGFEPCEDMHMLMPYNIMFRYPDAMAKQMYIHTKAMAEKLAKDIAEDNLSKPRFNIFTTIGSYILRLQWFGAKINGPLYKVNPSLCLGCGLCAEKCPSGNIKMIAVPDKRTERNNDNDRSRQKASDSRNTSSEKSPKNVPETGGHCSMCMRCVMYCPASAISPGFLTPWKVNGAWDFEKLLKDDSIPSDFTSLPEAKYFRSFRKYYRNNP